MHREYYSASIKDFLAADPEIVLGQLMIRDEFSTTDLQKNAWRKEISILQLQLQPFNEGEIAFEYTIPRIGHRIDVVCIIRGVIFLLEFKVGDKEFKKVIEDQVMDYALDLKYFHEMSRDRYIVPISIPTEALAAENSIHFMDDKIAEVICCNKDTIGSAINNVLETVHELRGMLRELKEKDYVVIQWGDNVPYRVIINNSARTYDEQLAEYERMHQSARTINNYNFNNSGGIMILGNVSDSTILFDALREKATQIQDGEEISARISDMENSVGTKTFTEKYNAFIQAAANHMTLFAPLIPALTQLLSQV